MAGRDGAETSTTAHARGHGLLPSYGALANNSSFQLKPWKGHTLSKDYISDCGNQEGHKTRNKFIWGLRNYNSGETDSSKTERIFQGRGGRGL